MGISTLHKRILELLRRLRLGMGARIRISLVDNRRMGWNIGNHPARYQPPHRPHGGPVGPPNQPIRRGGFSQPNPVIAVNRIPSSPAANPVHVVGRPVTIAGNTVEPLRPLSPRPMYSPSTASGFNRSNPGYSVHGYAYAGSATGGSGYVPGPTPPSSGHPLPAATYRAPTPSRGYSGGSAPSRAPSSGAVHPSSGGGGGGHVSSGGGGGGGGGHAGGGGGGGHH